MKNLLYILLLSFALASCKSAKPRVDSVRTVDQNTTTTITHTKKTDTIPIAGDLVTLKVPLSDLSTKPTTRTSKDGRATATITKVDDNIVVDCECAEEKVLIESQNTLIETLTQRLETDKTTVTEIEFRVPWYAKILSVIGFISLLLIGLKFLKPF